MLRLAFVFDPKRQPSTIAGFSPRVSTSFNSVTMVRDSPGISAT
jgi:hypothetical protein